MKIDKSLLNSQATKKTLIQASQYFDSLASNRDKITKATLDNLDWEKISKLNPNAFSLLAEQRRYLTTIETERKEFDKMTPLGKLQQMGRNLKSWLTPEVRPEVREPIHTNNIMDNDINEFGWKGRK